MGVLLPCKENMMETNLEPTAGFEGFEKRLEIEFFVPSVFSDPDGMGLRMLSRAELNALLHVAECSIVSELKNGHFDSYVLSESSLFVYPYKIVLKTCGTTKPLKAIPLLLSYASNFSLKVKSCKYSRGAFLFPKDQPFPHGNFSDEVKFLEKYFGSLGGRAYVMGDVSGKRNWHIYSAADIGDDIDSRLEPVYTLEVCMTQLDKGLASKFFKGSCGSAAEMTQTSGIIDLLPGSNICDYAFDPCGYSMNGTEDNCFYTIHVTPEDSCSYASFECMGYNPQKVNLCNLVEKVICCFKPASFSLFLHVSGSDAVWNDVQSWGKNKCPSGYVCDGTSWELLPTGMAGYCIFKENIAGSLSFPQPGILFLDEELQLSKLKSELTKCAVKMSQYSGISAPDAGDVPLVVSPVIVDPAVEELDMLIEKINLHAQLKGPLYVMDLGLLRHWNSCEQITPRVQPLYAVKCNSDGAFLALLAALVDGFDMVSKAEGETVRKLGMSVGYIIFCKFFSKKEKTGESNGQATSIFGSA
eukprot:c27523_g1_i3 orf=410-1990(-)